MGFRKTGLAVQTCVVSKEEARELTQNPPPPNPEVGDVWEGMVWDGGAWVTQEAWTRLQQRGEA